MIIGFLGKGGSGKSTLSARFAESLARAGKRVLAVDADHNMDLSYNLGAPEDMTFLGAGLPAFKDACGLGEREKFADALLKDPLPRFALSPLDPFTARYSIPVQDNLRLMSAGPHTDAVLYAESCSHTLTSPLRAYLPLLELQEDEYAVIDERAGADSASTGIPTGFDLAVIVAEPLPHSMKTARQIAEMLEFYGVPYVFAANKLMENEKGKAMEEALGEKIIARFPWSRGFSTGDPTPEEGTELEKIHTELLRVRKENGDQRLSRAKAQHEKNREFWDAKVRA